MTKTFIFDIDGTIVKNLTMDELDNWDSNEVQELLPNVKHFFLTAEVRNYIIIFVTARRESHRELTEKMLKHHDIKYKCLIMELNQGERYLVNDTPNVFYNKAIGVNILRDVGFGDSFIFDPEF